MSIKLKKFTNNLTRKQLNQRENLIFDRDYDSLTYYDNGGICRFNNLPMDKVRELILEGLADPNDRQNYCPSIVDIYNWCVEHNSKNWYAHGYVVSGSRSDCRVSIEGIGSYKPLKKDVLAEFKTFFSSADCLEGNTKVAAYCWFD